METMTIHRALSELKLIDSKVGKHLSTFEPVGIAQKDKRVNGIHDQSQFETDAVAKFQSITDLLNRKTKIKSAIVQANSSTKVVVNGVTMTIADAINFKQTIDLKRSLLKKLEERYNSAVYNLENHNSKVEENALRLAESALKKDNVKINDKDAVAITEPYLQANSFHLVDPLNAQNTIDKLFDEIEGFLSEVDSVLSEANATTTIEI